MRLYDILRDFKGSQDGRFTEQFTAGTQRELSDYLVACIDPSWARLAATEPGPVEPVAENVKIAKVPMTRGAKPAK